MDDKVDVSIIIPVYNIVKYIDECLINLIGNVEITYEVLIINDGSTDKSRDKANCFAENNSNFKIIDKINGGLSSARNEGLKFATGKYVFFLDGDDFINIHWIEQLCLFAKSNDLDIAIGNGKYYFEDNKRHNRYFHEDESLSKLKDIVTGESMFSYMIKNHCYKIQVWDKLYRREFIMSNNIFFKEGLLHEDELFTPNVFYYARKVKYYGNIDYNYRQRALSITQTVSIKNANSYIKIVDEFMEKEFNEGEYSKALRQRLVQLYFRTFQISLRLDKKDKKIIKEKMKKRDIFYKFNGQEFGMSFILRNYLFENFEGIYSILYNLLRKIRFYVIGQL